MLPRHSVNCDLMEYRLRESLTSSAGARVSAGIGADDMFQLMIEWRATNPRDETEVRLANTLRSAAVSITITSLTEILSFCIGATSPFLGVRNFCACSGANTSIHNVDLCNAQSLAKLAKKA